MLQSGPRRVRERRALGLASALHLTALLGLGAWAIHRHPPTARVPVPRAVDRTVEQEVEVDFDAIEQAEPHTAADAADREPVAAWSAATASGARRQGAPFPAHARAPKTDSGEDSDSHAHAEGADVTASAEAAAEKDSVSSIDLGLGRDAWQHWLGNTKSNALPDQSAARASNRRRLFRAPPKSTTGGLQEGLEAHDRAAGLGPSGPVISALYNAAHASTAPETGVARFQVTVLETGSVEIWVSEAADHLEGWRAIAAQAAEALRHAPPHLPSGRAGMRLIIELRAEEALPNGVRTTQLADPHLQVDPVRFRSAQEAQAILKERNPVAGENKLLAEGTKANVEVPGIYLAGRGKVCSYRVGLTVLGLPQFDGGCDPSNIGARPRRMVHTLVREEVLF